MIRNQLATLALAACWLATLIAGLALLRQYESTPGAADESLDTWPAASELPAPAGRATILLFAHPRCPCTVASLENLAWVLDRAPIGTRAIVVLVRPPGAGAEWEHSNLADSIASMPRIELHLDSDGPEARRFGAETSGQTFLYDAAGRLAYRGGLTAGRGLTGPSIGRTALLSRLTELPASVAAAAVYGCPLFTPSSACAEGCPACPK
jgi:hypothetical protein